MLKSEQSYSGAFPKEMRSFNISLSVDGLKTNGHNIENLFKREKFWKNLNSIKS